VLCSSAFLSVPALGSTGSAAVAPALFVGFPATMAGSFEQFVGQNDGLFPPKLGFAESPDGYLNKEIN